MLSVPLVSSAVRALVGAGIAANEIDRLEMRPEPKRPPRVDGTAAGQADNQAITARPSVKTNG